MTGFPKYLAVWREDIEARLAAALPTLPASHKVFEEAMAYSLLGGGKRVRACFFLLMAKLFQLDLERAYPYALALEMIHAYSLIHDDLPAMDDDDWRRGKASSHKAFGEDMAILAGDALLNRAHELLITAAANSPADAACAAFMAKAAGACGMVGGQVIDVRQSSAEKSETLLLEMIDLKTGALFQSAIYAPALLAERCAEEQQLAWDLAVHLGRVFQFQDDLLDSDPGAEKLGKSRGKDIRDHKLTALSIYGKERLSSLLRDYQEKIEQIINEFVTRNMEAKELREFCELLWQRRY